MSRVIASSDVIYALGYTPANQAALPIATVSSIGAVKPGTGLTVASDGTLSATGGGGSSYVLPIATSSVLGGVKQGVNVTIASDGTISATGGGAVSSVAGRTGAVTLAVSDVSGAASLASPAFSGTPSAPTATAGTSNTQLATTAFVANAVTASTTGVASFNTRTGAVTLTATDVGNVLPTASATVLGGVKIGTGITITNGVISAAAGSTYNLPVATATVLGGVKQGTGVTIAGDGTLSASGTAGVASFNTRTGAVTLTSADVTTALAFTPYNATNPSGYQTAAQVSSTVAAATSRNARIVTAAGAITVTSSDYYIGVKKTTPAATAVTLEASPVSGSTHVIKDVAQNSDTYPITITANPSSVTIDGAANFILNVPGGAITMLFNGTEWSLV